MQRAAVGRDPVRQRFGQRADAALDMVDAAAGQIERGAAVEGIGLTGRRLGGNQELAVEKSAKERVALGGDAAHCARQVRQGAQGGGAQGAGQGDEVSGALRRPGKRAGRDVPADAGQQLLRVPEAFRAGKVALPFGAPALGVRPLHDGTAIRQVHRPRRIGGTDRPLQIERCGDARVGAAGREAAGERGPGVKMVFLMVERPGAAAGIDMGFEDGHLMARFEQQGRRGQAADAGADDERVGWLGH